VDRDEGGPGQDRPAIAKSNRRLESKGPDDGSWGYLSPSMERRWLRALGYDDETIDAGVEARARGVAAVDRMESDRRPPSGREARAMQRVHGGS
jgi:hypothetical protein